MSSHWKLGEVWKRERQPDRLALHNGRSGAARELAMSTAHKGLPPAAEVEQALERAIERQVIQRTWRRIQALEVKVSDDLVILRGRALSYYVVQLALQGVLEAIDSAGTMRIELNIEVGSPPEVGPRGALGSCERAGLLAAGLEESGVKRYV
jgi:hypothetical protein